VGKCIRPSTRRGSAVGRAPGAGTGTHHKVGCRGLWRSKYPSSGAATDVVIFIHLLINVRVVHGSTLFWNVVLRPSHEHNKFFGSLDLLPLFTVPVSWTRQHQPKGGPAARHLTNVSVLAISLLLNQAICEHVVQRWRANSFLKFGSSLRSPKARV